MTYEADILKPSLDLVFAVTIEGVRHVLVEAPVAGAVFDDRPQLEVIPQGGLSFGETRIDIRRRAQNGGSFGLRLNDDPGGVLRRIFKPRQQQNVFLEVTVPIDTAMTGAGTVRVSDPAPFDADGGEAYIGGEAFAYTGLSSPDDPPVDWQLAGVTRAAWGTRAQRHDGGATADAGSPITTSPRAWDGRRVTVWAGYAQGGAVAAMTAIGTWRLNAAPKYSGASDTWQLGAGELADEYRQRQCYEGLREVPSTGLGFRTTSVDAHDLAGGSQFRIGGTATHALQRLDTAAGEARSLREVESVVGTTIATTGPDLLTPTWQELDDASGQGNSVVALQHVALLQGDPIDIALKLLLSGEGQGDEGDYDVLPGRASTSYGAGSWRMGAGFREDEVDVASFTALLGGALQWHLLLAEPLPVEELLSQLCRAVGGFWYVDSLGRLALGRIEERASPGQAVATVQVDEDTELPDSPEDITYDEREIVHTLRLRANWDPFSQEFLVTTHVVDWELKKRYPGSTRVGELDSKMLQVDLYGLVVPAVGAQRVAATGAQPLEDVQVAQRRAQTYAARGIAEYVAECAWPAAVVSVGQIVVIEHDRIPDLEGGVLSGRLGLVVGRQIKPDDGKVALRLRLIDTGHLIAPAGIVDSVSTTTVANDTMNLDATHPSVDPSLPSPASAFAAGWKVHVYTGGTFLFERTIAAIDEDAHTVRFTQGSAGALYFFPMFGEAEEQAPSGFSEADFLFQTLGDGAAARTRWS